MKKTDRISRSILAWYGRCHRDLPWRRTGNPYHIWVSEVMLQQTRVETVIPYYRRFLKNFPTVQDLAGASLEDVLMVWENLGYYARARNLHEAARVVSFTMDGRLPDRHQELRALPGIGSDTAAAILSFAFGQRTATVDGNVRRILSRLYAVRTPLSERTTLKRLSTLAEGLVPERDSSLYNQGLMDLGAGVCTARNPACGLCPLRELCMAFKKGLQEALPVTRKRPPLPHREMTAAVIRDSRRRILIVQRQPRGLLGGLWKFPGGERDRDESLEETLQRTVLDELGLQVKVGKVLTSVKHAYTHFKITLHAFRCTRDRRRPRGLGCARWQWTTIQDLTDFPFSRVDRKIMEAL
jgi:A/G-specific adenine glycosylase